MKAPLAHTTLQFEVGKVVLVDDFALGRPRERLRAVVVVVLQC